MRARSTGATGFALDNTFDLPDPMPNQFNLRMKQRHGCLTAWLIFVITANALGSLVYFFDSSVVASTLPSSKTWAIPVIAVLGVANIAFAIALFQWKRWGFYGLVLSTLIGFAVNIAIGTNPAEALVNLIGLAILYGVLQIGDTNKGWPQLE